MKITATGADILTKDLVIISTKKQEIWITEDENNRLSIQFNTLREKKDEEKNTTNK